jgi:hypothetical protein
MARRARESWMRTAKAATRVRNGPGSFLAPAETLDVIHRLVVNTTSRNRTLPLGSADLTGLSTFLAMGAHS